MVNNKKRIIISILTIIMFLSISFAAVYYIYNRKDNRTSGLYTGLVSIKFSEGSGTINLNGEVPKLDEVGLLNAPYNFTLKNTSDISISTKIQLEINDDTNIPLGAVRYAFYVNDELLTIDNVGNMAENNTLYSYNNLIKDESIECKLIFWIDYYYTESSKVFSAKIKVTGESNDTLVMDKYITYDDSGGSFEPKPTLLSNTGQTKISLGKPIKDNLNFLGWSTDPEATSPEYYSGDMYTGIDSVRLYAIYGEVQNKMGVLGENPNLIPYNTSISEINFVNMSQSDINTAYNNASIKFDFTASGSNNGSVLGWLTTDPNNATKYILTVASVGTTYFTTGYSIFCGYYYQNNWDYDFINVTTINLTNVDTSQVTDMNSMFCDCESLINLDVSGFNTSNVTDMSDMFYYCESLTNLDLSGFNTNNVTDMSFMFYYCYNLINLDLSSFNTSNVTNMKEMFYDCESLISLDLSRFNTSNVTDMLWMFCYCYALTNLDVSNFDTSKITDMNYMFYECYALTSLDVSSFDTSNVTDMSYMFEECESLVNLDLSSFDTSNVVDMGDMFYGCISLTSLDVSNFDTSKVTNMSYMFGSYWTNNSGNLLGQDNNLEEIIGLENFDTSKVAYMSYMFAGCAKLTDFDLSNFNTNNITTMEYMFYRCSSLESLDISNFNLSSSNTKLTKFTNMFTSIPVACQVKVKDLAAQTWVLTASNNHNASWSTSNVVIKS